MEIGDAVIEGKVFEKEKAQEKYEDAVASGHTAALANLTDEEETEIEIQLGNLFPGQEAKIHL